MSSFGAGLSCAIQLRKYGEKGDRGVIVPTRDSPSHLRESLNTVRGVRRGACGKVPGHSVWGSEPGVQGEAMG